MSTSVDTRNRLTNNNKTNRPPKPKGVPFRDSGSTLGSIGVGTPLQDVSECSRSSLKQDLNRRRSSLTIAEVQFLTDLCDKGDDGEIQAAHEKLLDEDLFFDDTEGWGSDMIQFGPERGDFADSSSNYRGSQSERCLHYNEPGLGGGFGGDGKAMLYMDSSTRTIDSSFLIGSERRLAQLEQRRNSVMHEQMWKAHENGLPATKNSLLNARRRSLLSTRRRNSIAKLEHIFRASNNAKNNKYIPLDDIRSDNNRRKSIVGPVSPLSRRRSSLSSSIRRDSYRRFESDASGRKSVTFKEEQLYPINKAERSNSIGSFPSLHHALPLSSSGVMFSPLDGLPARKAKPLRKSSMSSVPSIHMAHSVHSDIFGPVDSDISESERITYQRDEDNVREEKKSAWDEALDDDDDDDDAVPTKVVVPKVQNATKVLRQNDPDTPLDISLNSSIRRSPVVPTPRPVLLREASTNVYNGEGFEILSNNYDDAVKDTTLETVTSGGGESLTSFGNGCGGGGVRGVGTATTAEGSIRSSNSFDETISLKRLSSIFRRGTIKRTLSDDDSAGIFLGGSRVFLSESSTVRDLFEQCEDDDPWGLEGDDSGYFDSWKVIEDEYANGYGGGGTLPFRILGTSADDIDAHPHVLSPPLMESLQAFLPVGLSGDNYWMKYSLVRDGASIHTFLQNARGAKYSIIAIETIDGEVFGSFTGEPWRKNWNYFGNGEAFLWKMRQSRKVKCHSIIDQAQMESEIEVYPYTGVNNCIQIATHDKIAVGGGSLASSQSQQSDNDDLFPTSPASTAASDIASGCDSTDFKEHEWGHGISIESDFLHGTSSPCLTFGSPSLSTEHSDGSIYEIMNLELWTFTPCYHLHDAEKLELGKLFLERHSSQGSSN